MTTLNLLTALSRLNKKDFFNLKESMIKVNNYGTYDLIPAREHIAITWKEQKALGRLI